MCLTSTFVRVQRTRRAVIYTGLLYTCARVQLLGGGEWGAGERGPSFPASYGSTNVRKYESTKTYESTSVRMYQATPSCTRVALQLYESTFVLYSTRSSSRKLECPSYVVLS